jgi:UrcA family protein
MKAMKCIRSGLVGLPLILSSWGSDVLADTSDGIPQSWVTVRAHRNLEKRQIGRSESGIPTYEYQLSRKVSYGDLNLATADGRAELNRRIAAASIAACRKLQDFYPSASWETENTTCVAEAVRDAKAQEKVLLAKSAK